nr:hypothetical protein [Tanacetum cinerariifolium]
QENTTEPGVLGNYGFVAKKGTNSTVPDDDAVPADAVPASAFICAEPTIPADRVIAAEASILVVVGIPLDSEFALMNLPSKGFGDSKLSVFNSNKEDWKGKPIYNRFTKVNHYKGVPPPMNGNYMPTSTSPDTAE